MPAEELESLETLRKLLKITKSCLHIINTIYVSNWHLISYMYK